MYWQPTASIENLHLRAALLQQVRQFFSANNVLEVEVPILVSNTTTEPHIHSMSVNCQFGQTSNQHFYLNTSPEYALKRLLSSGSGPIYSITKVFRDNEIGRHHNPEFTMLEWYRPGYGYHELMREVADLINQLFDVGKIDWISYQSLFERSLDIDPHRACLAELKQLIHEHIDLSFAIDNVDAALEVLMSHVVEPLLAESVGDVPTFVYDFPVGQAALANITVNDSSNKVAQRFELYYQGIELANGYDELTDPIEQRRRFLADNKRRRLLGLPEIALDEKLLAALSNMPACSGVAIGIDRLLMAKARADSISELISFTSDRI